MSKPRRGWVGLFPKGLRPQDLHALHEPTESLPAAHRAVATDPSGLTLSTCMMGPPVPVPPWHRTDSVPESWDRPAEEGAQGPLGPGSPGARRADIDWPQARAPGPAAASARPPEPGQGREATMGPFLPG